MTTSTLDFAAAAAVYHGDWDTDGTTSVHLPTDLALGLLERQGWTVEPVRGGNAYVMPGHKARADGGVVAADYVWELDEAVRLAITAEALRCALTNAQVVASITRDRARIVNLEAAVERSVALLRARAADDQPAKPEDPAVATAALVDLDLG